MLLLTAAQSYLEVDLFKFLLPVYFGFCAGDERRAPNAHLSQLHFVFIDGSIRGKQLAFTRVDGLCANHRDLERYLKALVPNVRFSMHRVRFDVLYID